MITEEQYREDLELCLGIIACMRAREEISERQEQCLEEMGEYEDRHGPLTNPPPVIDALRRGLEDLERDRYMRESGQSTTLEEEFFSRSNGDH